MEAVAAKRKTFAPAARTPEQLEQTRAAARVAIERFVALEHRLRACLACEVETMGRYSSVTDEAAYGVRRAMLTFLAALGLDPAPDLPLCVLHPVEWHRPDELSVVPPDDLVSTENGQPTTYNLPGSPDSNCPAEAAAAESGVVGLVGSTLPDTTETGRETHPTGVASVADSLPDLIVCRSNTERDRILDAYGLTLVNCLPNTRIGRGKLMVRPTGRDGPTNALVMILPEHVETVDVTDKVVCGDIPLRLGRLCKLVINVEDGPDGSPYLAAYRVHRATGSPGTQ